MNYFPESVDVPPMDPVIKQQWLKALRSGEYKQGQRALKKKIAEGELQYCCLGVLCELHRKATKEFQWQAAKDGSSVYLYNTFKGCLPIQVSRWAGLSSHRIENRPADAVLAAANDKGADFPTIANWIEANL